MNDIQPTGEPGPIVGPVQPAPVRPRRRVDLVAVLLAIAVVIAVGGVSFAVGRVTAPQVAGRTGAGAGGSIPGGQGGQFPGGGQNGGQFPGRNNGFGGLLGGGVSIRGTVAAIASDHITLTLASGGTIDIPTDAQTTYHRQGSATASDVTSGLTVMVQLQPNAIGAGPIGPNASDRASPGASGGLGRLTGPARDITIVAPQ